MIGSLLFTFCAIAAGLSHSSVVRCWVIIKVYGARSSVVELRTVAPAVESSNLSGHPKYLPTLPFQLHWHPLALRSLSDICRILTLGRDNTATYLRIYPVQT
jgi:hypothetical protein